MLLLALRLQLLSVAAELVSRPVLHAANAATRWWLQPPQPGQEALSRARLDPPLACSEVRAASLSGDCNWTQEAARGHLSLGGQHQVCCRRRAELSVGMNPACQGVRAREAVAAVFDACFADTAPFDRRP